MKDNIKPEHYRKGEIDLYEAFSQIFPHNEYRAGMQMIAMRYMFRDKIDRVEDIDKAMETLNRWKEKEIEYRDSQVKSKDEVIDDAIEFMNKHKNIERVCLLINLLNRGYEYLARDNDDKLWVYEVPPIKTAMRWLNYGDAIEEVYSDYFQEVAWEDDYPTKIADLLETYENGGENGK